MVDRLKSKRGKVSVISPDDFDFKELFDANYRAVYRHILMIVGVPQIAEDIAQDTFLKLYEQPPREFTNLSGWLFTVASHLTYNYLRGEKSRKAREEKANREPDIYNVDYEAISEVENTRELLQRLEPRDRIVLVMKFSGFSYEDISKVIGIRKNSVGTVLARALAKFKKIYERERA